MAKHEFGIMQNNPTGEERFDSYEPQKYNCISVDDDFIESIITEFQSIDCYWHTLQRSEKGLAYCGITLIPPESMELLISILVFQNKEEYSQLIYLVNQARENKKYLIHFGI